MAQTACLEFEKPFTALEEQIRQLEKLQIDRRVDMSAEIRDIRRNLVDMIRKKYSSLTPWELVQVARHPARPLARDYIDTFVTEFKELHGDRYFSDDKAIITGFGRLGGEKVMIVATHKGRDTEEKVACHFGLPHPEGYRKALRAMRLAEKFHLPVVSLIDTAGAFPGIGAEERGQAQAIAVNLMEMSRLRTPIVCALIGEGGSGGALGIGVGDRIGILEYAYYSVITPEGCAAILWRDAKLAPQAAEALHLTPKDLIELGVVDEIIPEPVGGAHRDPREMATVLERRLTGYLRQVRGQAIDTLLENRYERLRKLGPVTAGEVPPKPQTQSDSQTASADDTHSM
ncbi:MAG: acetyl-CoA carboxylase carboxyltransferase subunit alpha [Planctomycetes bacterium]|nr:acetyl-CoA carboxylase carboxyltransferase subunit alpha [Planctomycetota bacterium]